MGLNWNEIKSRALLFSKTWADACNEDSQAKPFWIDFFEIFGITNKRVASGQAAQCVLDARAQFARSSLADLYDPLTRPRAQLKAHQKPDTAYQPSSGKKTCASDPECVAFVFELYQRSPACSPPEKTLKGN
jgi:hypothetical protein